MRMCMAWWLGSLLLAVVPRLQAGETVTYYLTDAQGTVLMTEDANGVTMATYDYRPYGASEGAPVPTGPGYTGHVNDPDTGLVYMQQRYYDAEIGRFLSVDPVGPASGNVFNFGRYTYANDSPYRYTDPDGRNGTEALGGLFYESWSFVTGNGFHGSQIVGALKDGYNGEGGGVLDAVLQDTGTISAALGVAGAIKGGAALITRFAAKKVVEEAAGVVGDGTKVSNKVADDLGTIFVDSKGNAIPTPKGGSVTSSPDGRFMQVRDANGKLTGARIDGPHKPATHPDPRAQQPHAHIPGLTNPDGTPWLPIKF